MWSYLSRVLSTVYTCVRLLIINYDNSSVVNYPCVPTVNAFCRYKRWNFTAYDNQTGRQSRYVYNEKFWILKQLFVRNLPKKTYRYTQNMKSKEGNWAENSSFYNLLSGIRIAMQLLILNFLKKGTYTYIEATDRALHFLLQAAVHYT